MRVFGGSLAAGNSIFGDDNANSSAYGASVSTGNNGGYGFDGFNVIGEGGGGNYIGSSTAVSLGDINVNGEAWGMYGTGGGGGAKLRRNLPGTLSVGYALSCCIAVGFRDGAKGFDVFTVSDWSGAAAFNFNIASAYIFDGTNMDSTASWSYSQQNIFDIIVKQTTTNNMNCTVTSRVFPSNTNSVNKSGALKGFQFYSYSAGGGSNDFFANSVKVYRY